MGPIAYQAAVIWIRRVDLDPPDEQPSTAAATFGTIQHVSHVAGTAGVILAQSGRSGSIRPNGFIE
jgi:hypothetical protein